jgi:hypothetical protein
MKGMNPPKDSSLFLLYGPSNTEAIELARFLQVPLKSP